MLTGGLSSFSGLPLLLKLPCRLGGGDNHHCVLGESVLFRGFFCVYFPTHPNLITPVCVCVAACTVAKISVLIPSAKDSSHTRLWRVTGIVLHREEADEQRSN